MQISWNTNVNAPGCIGEIVAADGRTRLIQVDWDYPGVASTFGWSNLIVQKCQACGYIVETTDDPAIGCPVHFVCDADRDECEMDGNQTACFHHKTDGTVDCPDCGLAAGKFIESAGKWLYDHDGAATEDPGYFE